MFWVHVFHVFSTKERKKEDLVLTPKAGTLKRKYNLYSVLESRTFYLHIQGQDCWISCGPKRRTFLCLIRATTRVVSMQQNWITRGTKEYSAQEWIVRLKICMKLWKCCYQNNFLKLWDQSSIPTFFNDFMLP